MDIRQLQYFIAAAKSESFSKAADRMNISQSALGSQVRSLEQELGTDLFERHSRGTELTQSGRLLLNHAEEIVERIQIAKNAMVASQKQLDRNVVVGMVSTISNVLAAPLLYRMSEKYPEIRLDVIEEKSLGLIEKVASRDITIAVGFNSHHIPGVRWEPVLEEHLYFVESADHGKKNGGEMPLDEVAGHRLAMPGKPAVIRNVLEAAAAAQGLKLNIPYNVNSTGLVRTLVLQGAAASVMPLTAVHDQVMSGKFIAKRITPSIYREVYFIYSEQCHASQGAAIVKRELLSMMKNGEQQRVAGWEPLRDREAATNRAYVAEALTPPRPLENGLNRSLATV